MRSDARYRQVLAVHQVLDRPELKPTEGPGELRLGVPALPRLYEYWVFLQVLVTLQEKLGPPDPPGFDVLSINLTNGRRRLEMSPGTTVTFGGNLHAAFEPSITTKADGWKGIEYVPHPDQKRQQFRATPDVVVFQERSGEPCLLVLDAKYVSRHMVEYDAARIHAKYARMRWEGRPVVRDVLAVHPHAGLDARWAGYGHFAIRPEGRPRLPDSLFDWITGIDDHDRRSTT